MSHGIDRVDGGWNVGAMRGIGIGEVILGGALRLHAGSNRIEVHGPAELTTDGETVPVHAAARINLDRAVRLLDQVLTEVHAADSGGLRVRFASGWGLTVPVSAEAVGWIVGLRDGYAIHPLPGGGTRVPDPLRR